ncbi:MAG: hypothetical protein ACC726_10465 [Chloroflexota bacterium]
MKRTDLIKQIAKAAKADGVEFELLRTQGIDDIYTLGGVRLSIPRHREIAEGTADGIRKQAGTRLGKRWWR